MESRDTPTSYKLVYYDALAQLNLIDRPVPPLESSPEVHERYSQRFAKEVLTGFKVSVTCRSYFYLLLTIFSNIFQAWKRELHSQNKTEADVVASLRERHWSRRPDARRDRYDKRKMEEDQTPDKRSKRRDHSEDKENEENRRTPLTPKTPRTRK